MRKDVAGMEAMPPVTLSRALGQQFPPTDQQADVIGADPGPLLVVAGAGAGKTETMAARVVWLVANGYARPDEILGLTFTRKAAMELGKRIRDRLGVLARDEALVRRLAPGGELADALQVIAPTVSTYDAYAGDLIREYGLLVPVEPDARLITAAELHAIATEVVTDYPGELISSDGTNPSVGAAVGNLLGLITSMGNELAPGERVADQAETFLKETASLAQSARSKVEYSKVLSRWRAKQEERAAYLPLAQALNEELRRRGVVTFNEQMSVAAGLARDHALVGESQRRRYRVVMLDEYQDTSHAQRVLLRSLFGLDQDPELTVTAVGDPMQAIYGWRGATAANLEAFVEDFPLASGAPAPKKQLTTSWRNPPEVLALANGVSDNILGTGDARAVAALEPRPGAGAGEVTLGYFDISDEEVAYVADHLAARHAEAAGAGEALSAAVLVRKNRHSAGIAEALEARGVPYEIVGVAGLLDVPEVADTIAIATMLVRPGDNAAALRVLAGPAVGLGLKDLDALAARAANLRARESGPREGQDAPEDSGGPEEQLHRLQRDLEALVERARAIGAAAERPAGLTDAVADLGEPDRYSPEGLARLTSLASVLRDLRTHSLGKRLTDLFADIIRAFNIRTEVLARGTDVGATHLDRLLEEVAAYPGTNLAGLLDYFELARTHEDGLAPGNVTAKPDRVQILTAHKAKGLEWDTVCVLHADEHTYAAKAETFLTFLNMLQDDTFGDPELTPEFAEVETRTDFQKAAEAWLKTVRADQAEEAARLFYVAVTRAAERLVVTASRTSPGTKREAAPYEHFDGFRRVVPPASITTWSEAATEAAPEAATEPTTESALASGQPSAEREGTWPQSGPDPGLAAGAEAVNAARASLPPLVAADPANPADLASRFADWERDVTALIDEHAAEQTTSVAVEVPGELTASDVVAMHKDPAQFASRARRPVPFKPNAFAKRGTAFHTWIEGVYGARPLLDENELPGSGEEETDAGILERLKENFDQSHWAKRTPAFVERPFELSLGDAVVRGRIDAVFEDPGDSGGWAVVDWKTGQKPDKQKMASDRLQLAVYAEAWRRIAADGKPVRAVFFYVRTGEDFAPQDLPAGEELERLLWGTVSTDRPAPGAADGR